MQLRAVNDLLAQLGHESLTFDDRPDRKGTLSGYPARNGCTAVSRFPLVAPPAIVVSRKQQARGETFIHCSKREQIYQTLHMQNAAELCLPAQRPYRGSGEFDHRFHDGTARTSAISRRSSSESFDGGAVQAGDEMVTANIAKSTARDLFVIGAPPVSADFAPAGETPGSAKPRRAPRGARMAQFPIVRGSAIDGPG